MRIRTLLMTLLGLSAGAAQAQDAAILAPAEALSRMEAGTRLLIDVRTPAEWRTTGVPHGAMTVDLNGYGGPSGFAAEVEKRLNGDKSRPLAVICRSGHRSTLAQTALLQAGFTDVANVKEGVEGGPNGPGWIGRGLPVQ